MKLGRFSRLLKKELPKCIYQGYNSSQSLRMMEDESISEFHIRLCDIANNSFA